MLDFSIYRNYYALMINRELYMKKIRPFIDKPLIKVFSGIRRCGKSVMLELVQKELLAQGIGKEQILALNFESGGDLVLPASMRYTMQSKHAQEITKKGFTFFLMKFRNYTVGKDS